MMEHDGLFFGSVRFDAAPFAFAFAYDNPSFSDRVLCIKIETTEMDMVKESKPKPMEATTTKEEEAVNAKEKDIKPDEEMEQESKREYDKNETKEKMAHDDGIIEDDHHKEAHKDDVVTVHVNSMLLAARSQFFLSLFSTGMKETQSKEVTTLLQSKKKRFNTPSELTVAGVFLFLFLLPLGLDVSDRRGKGAIARYSEIPLCRLIQGLLV